MGRAESHFDGGRRGGGHRTALTVVTGAVVFLILAWLAGRSDRLDLSYPVTGRQADYYNLLVDGFLKGQLHLDVEVHPGLLSDDQEVRLRSPFLLDANLYQGRYYLYYGVVPAALLMLPYTFLTGHDLGLNVVVLVFLALGYFCAIQVFDEVRRAHFRALSRPLHVCFLVLLGLGSGIPFLAARSMFYEAPIAAGYACSMAAIWALWRALQAPERALRPLLWASLSLSLAVGCRPNYFLALPVLLLPVWLVWRANRRSESPSASQPWPKLLLAVLLPSVAVGSVLAWYNYARFGNPLEFGFKYGMNTFFWTDYPFASGRFIWSNLKWYYFTPPAFSPYFPFFFPINASFRPEGYYGDEAMHGHFFFTLLIVTVVVLVILQPGARERLRALWSWLGTLGWISLSSLAFMLILTIRGNRYSVDFQAPLVLLLVCVAGVALTETTKLRRLTAIVVAALACVASGMALGSSVQQFDDLRNMRPKTFEALSRVLNQPSAWATRLGLLRYGPVSFDVVFQSVETPRYEPLIALGTPYYSDALLIAQHPGNLVEFHLSHHGYGGPKSELITIEPGRAYRIEVLMGALFPPKVHPFFEDVPVHGVRWLKDFAQVTMDGTVIVEGQLGSYDAPPWTLQLGKNFITHNPFGPVFSGEIRNLRRTGFALPHDGRYNRDQSGTWQLMLQFAWDRPGTAEPLVAAGRTGAGNLLFVEVIDDEHVQFSVDIWGHGLISSPPIHVPHHEFVRLGLFFGPIAQRHDWPEDAGADPAALDAQARTLRVWLEREVVWTTTFTHHLDSFDVVEIGANPQGFSTARHIYLSPLYLAPVLPNERRQFLADNLALPPGP